MSVTDNVIVITNNDIQLSQEITVENDIEITTDSRLIEKEIDSNGVYAASADQANGFSKVTVEVLPNVDSLDVTENGTYNASEDGLDGYSEVVVDIQPNLGTKTVTENGTYDASDEELDGFSQVTVNVQPDLGTKTITENGTYSASDDELDGFSQVVVDTPTYEFGIKTITANGTYNASADGVDGFSQVVVNTPSPDSAVRAMVEYNGTFAITNGSPYVSNNYREKAFNYNPNITEVDTDEITTISRGDVFSYCDNLTRVVLDNLTSLGSNAFMFSKNILYVSMNKMVNVAPNCFYGCSKIVEASFLNANQLANQAMRDCTALKTLHIPKVTNLVQYCLISSGLEELDLQVCGTIGTYALASTKLAKLIIRKSTVCSLMSNGLNNTPIANGNGYIYVPDNLVDSYKAATNWVLYEDQIKGLSELEEV